MQGVLSAIQPDSGVALGASADTHQELLERFAFPVPGWRQRYESVVSAASMERFYRVCRAACASEENLREPLTGALECDEMTFGRRSARQTLAEALPAK